MIKTAIDTDLIGKHIWEELYRLVSKHTDQSTVARKLWVKPNSISVYLTWKTTTRNIEQYWKIAEAIPISRSEFDRIVQEAKRKVLGDSWIHNVNDWLDPTTIKYATMLKETWMSEDDMKKMIAAYRIYNS